MSARQKIMSSLKDNKLLVDQKEYRFMVERGGRLDLPREDFASPEKKLGQRRKNLLHADCILLDESNRPRMLIEVVSSNEQDPNGIVGLVINLDRLTRLGRGDYSGVDLLFVVLGQIKRYWCPLCKHGHYLSRALEHFLKAWKAAKAISPVEILHEGLAMKYRKALLDYPIAPYLRTIRVPSVLFLNSERIMNDWRTYQTIFFKLINTHISQRIRNADRNINPVFDGIEQLFTERITKMLGFA